MSTTTRASVSVVDATRTIVSHTNPIWRFSTSATIWLPVVRPRARRCDFLTTTHTILDNYSFAGGGPGDNLLSQLFASSEHIATQYGVDSQLQRSMQHLTDNLDLEKQLPTIIRGLSLDNMEWVNQVALPAEFTYELTFFNRTVEFESPLAGEVPELGTSRIVKRSAHTQWISLARYGIAIAFSNDRLKTREGQEDFLLGLQQLALIMAQNLAHCAITSIFDPDPDRRLLDRNIPERGEIARSRERDEFAAGQKSDRSFGVLFSKKREMLRVACGQQPNILIMDPLLQGMLTTQNPMDTEYFRAGPSGPIQFHGDAPIRSYNGVNIFQLPAYDPSHDQRMGITMSDADIAVGTYFHMENRYLAAKGYETASRDIMVYDEDFDDFRNLAFSDAFDQCRRFQSVDDGGELLPSREQTKDMFWSPGAGRHYATLGTYFAGYGLDLGDGGRQMKKNTEMQKAIDEALVKLAGPKLAKFSTALNPVGTALSVTSCVDWPINKRVLNVLLAFDLPFPFDVLVMRPWSTYRMSTAVMMVGGTETGTTKFGHVDVTTATQGTNKSTFVHASWQMGAVIRRPERIMHLPNLSYKARHGGCGTDWITDDQFRGLKDNTWEPTLGQYRREYGSIYSVLVPYGWVPEKPDCIDIRGHFEDEPTNSKKLHYPSAAWYANELGLEEIFTPPQIGPIWKVAAARINTVVFQGMHYVCMDKPCEFNRRLTGRGHQGDVEYPGCRAVRDGLELMDHKRCPERLTA